MKALLFEGNRTGWDALIRFMVYLIHFRRLENCLLAFTFGRGSCPF
jgi:hypothetical protein